VQQVAAGAVTARAHVNPRTAKLRVVIDIAPGWHVNAHEPLEEYLLPTVLRAGAAALPKGAYPAADIQRLGFSDSPLALYEGTVVLEMDAPEGAQLPVVLEVQACNDAQCLQPEELRWRFWRGL